MSPPGWTPTSWRSKPIAQDVSYAESSEHLDKVLSKLRRLPPLVTPVEVDRLRKQLAEVAVGKAFLLQGGDCAELFDDCSQDPIEHKLSLILIMSLIILHGSRLPVVRIARIAGQYAKPRSKPTEVVEINGEKKEVLSFRGDNVNGFEVDERKPDPERLLGAYFHSTTTLNYIRGLLSSGFADLHKPQEWSFSHVRSPALQDAFKNVIESLEDSLNFMRVASIGAGHGTESVDLYTSHEALMLEYEEALTRPVVTAPSPPPTRPSTPPPASPLLPRSRSTSHVRVNAQRERDVDSPARLASINHAISATGENPLSRTSSIEGVETNTEYYNLSAHFVWIGDRTRQLDGAHVEYFRGLANPIGIKVGPSMKPDELIALLDIVNPDRLVGKVTLIGRYGAAKVDEFLPQHIEAVKKTDHVVVWQCDAMHGNTQSSKTDATLKTRLFSDIIHEITRSMAIHRELGTILGGVHLELTGEVNEDGYSVTECIGGSMELEDKDLSFNYRSHCDPRLNYEQSLDVAFLIADHLKAKRRGEVPKDILLSGLRGRQ